MCVSRCLSAQNHCYLQKESDNPLGMREYLEDLQTDITALYEKIYRGKNILAPMDLLIQSCDFCLKGLQTFPHMMMKRKVTKGGEKRVQNVDAVRRPDSTPQT